MSRRSQPPLIVQRDRSVLLDLHAEGAEEVRRGLSRFAELVKSPEHLHTYRLSALSLWNAAGNDTSGDEIIAFLAEHSVTGVPQAVREYILEMLGRRGLVRFVRRDERIVLAVDESIRDRLLEFESVHQLVEEGGGELIVPEAHRGVLKQALLKAGYPVEDLAGYVGGDLLPFRIDPERLIPRPYQEAAAQAFFQKGSERGGAGLVVLPCGAGKTIVGLRVMELHQVQTLILSTNRASVKQWRRELLEKTSLQEHEIGEYSGERKEIRPVTISTYQILTHRRAKDEEFTHFAIFSRANWGLVIYDEVHLLPAPVFRVAADLQARRRLGLTATLVREDAKEDEVFSLIGPCRYELPWRTLEKQGFIAEAHCVEVRVPLEEGLDERYELASARERIRISSENPAKLAALQRLVEHHRDDRVLVIGQYLRQLYAIARLLDAPIITSRVSNEDRDDLYDRFRRGELPVLVVSKVANFAIDLPDANVAIQVSGTFGSRQEEAQRLGRVLRPKSDGRGARFYTLVTAETRDQEFANHRQLFLAEQGYRYEIVPDAERGLERWLDATGKALVAEER